MSLMAALEHKDVMVTLLAASAALAGLVLVFLGLVVSSLASLPADADDTVKKPYRISAGIILATFGFAVLCLGFSTGWLVTLSGNGVAYDGAIVTFVATLVALVVATIVVASQVIWRN
jgi:hypothetical protein